MHTLPAYSARRLSAGLIAAAVIAASSGPAWAARSSSHADSRGYQTCVEAAGREARLIQVDADYYIYDLDEARRFYLNGYAFHDGDSTAVKIACDTTRSGHRLLGVSVDQGTYAARFVEPVNVARN